jgi:hypothetical protein
MFVYFEKYNKWNFDVILQIILHISFILNFATFKPWAILNQIQFSGI